MVTANSMMGSHLLRDRHPRRFRFRRWYCCCCRIYCEMISTCLLVIAGCCFWLVCFVMICVTRECYLLLCLDRCACSKFFWNGDVVECVRMVSDISLWWRAYKLMFQYLRYGIFNTTSLLTTYALASLSWNSHEHATTQHTDEREESSFSFSCPRARDNYCWTLWINLRSLHRCE